MTDNPVPELLYQIFTNDLGKLAAGELPVERVGTEKRYIGSLDTSSFEIL